METATRYGAGKVDAELQAIVTDMATACNSVLAMRGILVSDRQKQELRRALHDAVHQSVEIEAKVVELMERPPAA